VGRLSSSCKADSQVEEAAGGTCVTNLARRRLAFVAAVAWCYCCRERHNHSPEGMLATDPA